MSAFTTAHLDHLSSATEAEVPEHHIAQLRATYEKAAAQRHDDALAAIGAYDVVAKWAGEQL